MKDILAILNSLACWIFILLDTVFWGTVSITSIIYSPGGRMAHFCMRAWSTSILFVCRIRVRTEGIGNIDPGRVQIFASNHSSHFDIFILNSVIPVKFGWVAKAVLFKIPFMGWHMKLNGYISVDRGNREKAINSMNEAAEKVKQGRRIMIFPEGTRSRTGELQQFKKGLFHLCVQTGVPIVPIYIKGSYNILKPDTPLIYPSNVIVKIGKEMPTAGYSVERLDDLMNDLRARIVLLQEEVDGMTESAAQRRLA